MPSIEDYFDTPEEALSYAYNYERSKLRNRKNACKARCVYQEDCPCDWDSYRCYTLNR